MDQNAKDKIRENRIRRMAKRQGYELLKSRRRDPRAIGYRRYVLWDPHKEAVLVGGSTNPKTTHDLFTATLDDLEAYLTGQPIER